MYGKLAMTWFKYQVYLYGSEAIRLPPPLTTGCPPPSLYGSITFTPSPIWKRTQKVWLNYHTYVKKQGEICMVEEPSHLNNYLYTTCVK